MKITILWSSLAGYSVAFFKELALSQHCEIQLIYFGQKPDAPYIDFDLSFCKASINRSETFDVNIQNEVNKFSPTCILMSSWNFSDYMKIAKFQRKSGTYVVSTIDHQWYGTLKQKIGALSAPIYLKPRIDCFLVAGDRQAYFASKLGYEKILYGLYAAAVEDFKNTRPLCERNPSFLFVGRLAPEKGVENLINGYRMYRDSCASPWDLEIAGTGEKHRLLGDTPGVKSHGFVQPSNLPDLMQNTRALILPSLWESWGVVIHEAAAAGLAIIASQRCGAVPAFVRDGVNGFIIQPNPLAIRDAMLKISNYSSDKLESFSLASRTLADLWTPRMLADYFVENVSILAGLSQSKKN